MCTAQCIPGVPEKGRREEYIAAPGEGTHGGLPLSPNSSLNIKQIDEENKHVCSQTHKAL
jgi:hypothetical protein